MRDSDLIIERLRRTGPGGQHRNKKATGVRITHLPTGIVVMASERRSQHQNLETAYKRLEAILVRRAQRKKIRKPAAPSAGARERRLQQKKRQSEKKSSRSAIRKLDD